MNLENSTLPEFVENEVLFNTEHFEIIAGYKSPSEKTVSSQRIFIVGKDPLGDELIGRMNLSLQGGREMTIFPDNRCSLRYLWQENTLKDLLNPVHKDLIIKLDRRDIRPEQLERVAAATELDAFFEGTTAHTTPSIFEMELIYDTYEQFKIQGNYQTVSGLEIIQYILQKEHATGEKIGIGEFSVSHVLDEIRRRLGRIARIEA